MLRKALLVLSSNVVGSIIGMVRNLLVARMIPVEDYGIASTLTLAVAVIEMASALGLQQQIVQARDGDDPRLQAALQGFSLLRGLMSGAILLLAAGPIADFMNVPEAAWGYRMMALLPVFGGLSHFDSIRFNRQMRFAPAIIAGLVPAVVSLLLVWPLVRFFGDWRAVLALTLTTSALAMAMSHVVARRVYEVRLDRAQMSRSLRFGWPLLLNNVLLFFVFQGDRLIVGRELGMAALGVFSMGVTLTLTPTLVLARSAQTLLLPTLSRIDRDAAGGRERFQATAELTALTALANGLAFMLGVVAVGWLFVQIVLGARYEPLLPLLVPLAAQQALRVFKAGPSVIALSVGRTGNAMIANLFRAATLPLAWMVVVNGGSLLSVVMISVLGEALGVVASFALVRRFCGVRLGPLAPFGMLALLFFLVALLPGLPLWLSVALLSALLLALLNGLNDRRRPLSRPWRFRP